MIVNRSVFFALGSLLILTACVSATTTPIPTGTTLPAPAEQQMVRSARITDVQLDKAFYRPGASIHLTVRLQSQVDESTPARLSAFIAHLATPIDRLGQEISLTGKEQTIELTYRPPADAPRGYGVEVSLETEAGARLDAASTAFDVLERWTQSPRYGFLADFAPGRSDAAEIMDVLVRYHVNGLQFYDWMYRHEQFLTDQEPYLDPLGRQLSRATVDALIAAAHQREIAAMPYTAVYGASVAFYEQHPDWVLLNRAGKPVFFGENFLVIMDSRPDSPWTAHLLDQFDQVLEQTAFDGIHLDQYGDPKVGYDAQGKEYDLAKSLAELINATHARVRARRPDGAVVFNAVTNWPIKAVAPADQDLVYIEVWPPYNWFNDLHQLVVDAQALGDGKPVVLAAYIDPAYEHNVRLMDAVIFASSGGHIELGERAGMLADPYFPKYKRMSPGLALAVRRLYDFAVRYQDVIGPRTQDRTRDYQGRVKVGGVSTSPTAVMDKVWPIVREGNGFTAISLVNLLGLKRPDWNLPIDAAPTCLAPTAIQVTGVERTATRIWLATPDKPDLSPHLLSFTQANGILSFEIPDLLYWNLIVIEWSESSA